MYLILTKNFRATYVRGGQILDNQPVSYTKSVIEKMKILDTKNIQVTKGGSIDGKNTVRT